MQEQQLNSYSIDGGSQQQITISYKDNQFSLGKIGYDVAVSNEESFESALSDQVSELLDRLLKLQDASKEFKRIKAKHLALREKAE